MRPYFQVVEPDDDVKTLLKKDDSVDSIEDEELWVMEMSKSAREFTLNLRTSYTT